MTLELFPYQKETVDRVVERDLIFGEPTYIAHEMGLGKTPIAIAIAKERGDKRVGVFCPPVAKLTWEKELKRWWPGVRCVTIESWKDIPKLDGDGVFIVAYSLLSQSKSGGYDYIDGIRKRLIMRPFDMSVLDEAHALKNSGAIRTKAVLKTLLPYLGWCLPMSGTPAPNHQGELFPVLAALYPKAIEGAFGKPMKQYEFESVYCQIVEKWFGGRAVRTIDGSKNIDALRSKLDGFIVRKRKKDVLKDLPDMAFDLYPVSAPNAPPWRGAGDWKGMSEDEFLRASQQFDTHVMTMRREVGEAKVQGAVEVVSDYLDGCRRKVVVFAHHTSVIAGMMSGLLKYHPVLIDGSVSKPQRDLAIKRFLDDPLCRVFVGQITAAGTSITLCGANNDVSDVFFVEADFSPGINVQAASRIHRIGQKNAVQVWFLNAAGTFDDRVMDINVRKARDFDRTFNQ